jgi:hypothetical protein
MAAKAKTQASVIPRINLKRIEVTIEGLSELIVHRWSDKAVQMIKDKQQKKAKQAKEARDPEAEYNASFYHDADGDFAFPCSGIKSCMVDACSYADGITKVSCRGAFHIIGDYAKIKGKEYMREDMVRIGMGTADIRYRGAFPEWSISFQIEYNENVISQEQIANLLDLAGYSVGLAEWRPQKNGSFGRFRIKRSR